MTAASGLVPEQSNPESNCPTRNRVPLGTWFAFSRRIAESLNPPKCGLTQRNALTQQTRVRALEPTELRGVKPIVGRRLRQPRKPSRLWAGTLHGGAA